MEVLSSKIAEYSLTVDEMVLLLIGPEIFLQIHCLRENV